MGGQDAAAAHNKRFHASVKPTAQQRQLNSQLSSHSADAHSLAALIRANVDAMNSVNCATALHQLAKRAATAEPDESLNLLLAARTAAVMSVEKSDVTPRSLTSIVWAVGKLRLFNARLRDEMAAHARDQLERGLLDAFGMANVAWALATLHQHAASASSQTVNTSEVHAALLDALAARACELPSEFKPQELCNLLWAYATLKVRHARLFEAFADAAQACMAGFTPQGLSQTIWAYSKLNLSKHALLLCAASHALPKLGSYDAQSLATLAWSFANLDVEHRPLLAAVCAQAKVDRWLPTEHTTIVAALSLNDVDGPAFALTLCSCERTTLGPPRVRSCCGRSLDSTTVSTCRQSALWPPA
jgi:hypothetical protein